MFSPFARRGGLGRRYATSTSRPSLNLARLADALIWASARSSAHALASARDGPPELRRPCDTPTGVCGREKLWDRELHLRPLRARFSLPTRRRRTAGCARAPRCTTVAGRRVSDQPLPRHRRHDEGPAALAVAAGQRALQDLSKRRRRRGSAGAVEDSGDGVGIGDDLADTHAAAACSAAGDVEREDAGEELCPGDVPGSGRGRGRGFGGGLGAGEIQRELWRRRRCGGLGDDLLA